MEVKLQSGLCTSRKGVPHIRIKFTSQSLLQYVYALLTSSIYESGMPWSWSIL